MVETMPLRPLLVLITVVVAGLAMVPSPTARCEEEEVERAPLERQRFEAWIDQLGSEDAAKAEEAHRSLVWLFVSPESDLRKQAHPGRFVGDYELRSAFAKLIEGLSAEKPATSRGIVCVLGDIAGQAGFLGNPFTYCEEPISRAVVAGNIAAHGPQVMLPLIEILKSEAATISKGLGYVAALALAQIGEPAVGPLLEVLAGEWPPAGRVDRPRDSYVIAHEAQVVFEARSLAAFALGWIPSAHERFIGPLLALLLTEDPRRESDRSEDPDQRELLDDPPSYRHQAFAQLGTKAVQPLLDALKQERDPYLCAQCLVAIGTLGSAAEDAVPILENISETDPDYRIQRLAFRTLKQITSGPSVGPLIFALLSDDRDVRFEAERKLSWVGIPAMPALIDLLGSADPKHRWLACSILYGYGPIAYPAIPALLELTADEDGGVRRSAIFAIGWIGLQIVEVPPDVIERLHELLADPDENTRQFAVCALGQLGAAAAVVAPDLLRLVSSDPSRSMRTDALIALSAVDPSLMKSEHVPLLVREIREDMGHRRSAARRAIGRLPPPAAEAIVPRLAEGLSTWRELPLSAAVEALISLGEDARAALPALEELAERTTGRQSGRSSHGAHRAIWIIHEDGVARAIRAIEASFDERTGLGSRMTYGLANPIETLGEIGPRAASAVPILLRILRQDGLRATMRPGAAAKALGQIQASPEDVVPLLASLLSHRHERVQIGALEGLGHFGEAAKAAAPRIAEVLTNEDDYVRARAAEALGLIGAPLSIPALIGALGDEDTLVRCWAADGLARYGEEAQSALPRLGACLRDEDIGVQKSAFDAIWRISGQPPALPLGKAVADDE